MMLVKIIRRAKELIAKGKTLEAASTEFDFFLQQSGIQQFDSNNILIHSAAWMIMM